jgi:PKD repeat protein
VTNSLYRVVDSDQSVGSGWGVELVTELKEPTLDADFSYAPVEIGMGSTVQFTDTSTTDGSLVAERVWDFGDGELGGGAVVTHTYTAAGSYTVTLRVTDSCGFSANAIVPQAVLVIVPEIDVSPQQLNSVLPPTGTTTRTLTIANLSSVVLTWTVAEDPDVAWLSLPGGTAMLPGETQPMESSEVLVAFDATDLSNRTYTTTLAVASNDPAEPRVDITVTLTVTTHAVYDLKVMGADTEMAGYVGQVMTYTLTVTNLANVDDSFTVDLDGNGWPATASDVALGPLAPNSTDTFEVYVAIPTGATDGMDNRLMVTITSVAAPSITDSVTLTTMAIWRQLYLSLVSKDY